jgi:hypothetical protein
MAIRGTRSAAGPDLSSWLLSPGCTRCAGDHRPITASMAERRLSSRLMRPKIPSPVGAVALRSDRVGGYGPALRPSNPSTLEVLRPSGGNHGCHSARSAPSGALHGAVSFRGDGCWAGPPTMGGPTRGEPRDRPRTPPGLFRYLCNMTRHAFAIERGKPASS